MQITAKAIVTPIYLNASDKFERWHSHNYQRVKAYFEALGGDYENVAEYVDFARCQFDRQQLSEGDVKILNEAHEQTVLNLAMLRTA